MKNEVLERLSEIRSMLEQQQPKPLTLPEAAAYVGLSKSTLYRMTSQGEIAYFKPSGKKIYFKKSDLDTYLFRNRSMPREEIRKDFK